MQIYLRNYDLRLMFWVYLFNLSVVASCYCCLHSFSLTFRHDAFALDADLKERDFDFGK